MNEPSLHVPVMAREAVLYLNVHSNFNYIDCTLGAGGYTELILSRNGPDGKIVAFELDESTIARTHDRFAACADRLTILHENFRSIAGASRFGVSFSGVVYDVGLSLDLLKNSGRGFSLLKDELLDMRFDIRESLTATQILATWSEKELVEMLSCYGEEPFARRIARAICRQRAGERITTTAQLCALVAHAIPARFRHGRIHCATRTFQALRIAVNDELSALQESLQQAVHLLSPGGRIVVVSFHSLEDRIVKKLFRGFAQQKRGAILTKKPVVPSSEEQKSNPSARSAKLRAFEIQEKQ